jgi:hypothetical protein
MSATKPQPRRERNRSFLRGILAGDELDVVDHQNVDRAELFLEVHRGAEAQRANELVHELLGRHVQHAARGITFGYVPRDGMHEMGLAEAYATEQKQRVKRHAIGFRDTPRCRMGEFVGPADDEIIEDEPWIEQRPNVFSAGRIGSAGALELTR